MNLKSFSSVDSFGSFRNPSGPLVLEDVLLEEVLLVEVLLDELLALDELFELEEVFAASELFDPPLLAEAAGRCGECAPALAYPVSDRGLVGRQMGVLPPWPSPSKPARPLGSKAVTSTSVMFTELRAVAPAPRDPQAAEAVAVAHVDVDVVTRFECVSIIRGSLW
jgi:hypothetical protein